LETEEREGRSSVFFWLFFSRSEQPEERSKAAAAHPPPFFPPTRGQSIRCGKRPFPSFFLFPFSLFRENRVGWRCAFSFPPFSFLFPFGFTKKLLCISLFSLQFLCLWGNRQKNTPAIPLPPHTTPFGRRVLSSLLFYEAEPRFSTMRFPLPHNRLRSRNSLFPSLFPFLPPSKGGEGGTVTFLNWRTEIRSLIPFSPLFPVLL